MAAITITVPTAAVADVISAFQAAFAADWVTAQAAGVTGAQFVQQRIAAQVESVYRDYKRSQIAPPPPAGVT